MVWHSVKQPEESVHEGNSLLWNERREGRIFGPDAPGQSRAQSVVPQGLHSHDLADTSDWKRTRIFRKRTRTQTEKKKRRSPLVRHLALTSACSRRSWEPWGLCARSLMERAQSAAPGRRGQTLDSGQSSPRPAATDFKMRLWISYRFNY